MNCLEDRRSDSTNNGEEEIIAGDCFVGCNDGCEHLLIQIGKMMVTQQRWTGRQRCGLAFVCVEKVSRRVSLGS
jgi:hypothetical protein